MFQVALILIALGLVLWLLLVAYIHLTPKHSSQHDIGGGGRLTTFEEPWSKGLEKGRDLREWDIKLLDRVYKYGEEFSIEDLEAIMGEPAPSLADQIRRLEQRGFLVRVSSGRYVLTEEGKRYLELYKERLWYRKREREILEGK